MISFQANYINSASIKYLSQSNEYQDMNTSLVELELGSHSDKQALKKISKSWGKEYRNLKKQGYEISGEGYFADDIYNRYKNSRKNPNDKNYYAITLQSDKFEKLNPDEVLGIAEIKKNAFGEYLLEALQVKPEHTAFIKGSKYKNIGRGFLDSLLETLNFKEFRVIPTLDTMLFYDKYGLDYSPETMTFYTTKKTHK